MSQNFTSIEDQPIFVGNKIKNSNLHIMRQYANIVCVWKFGLNKNINRKL